MIVRDGQPLCDAGSIEHVHLTRVHEGRACRVQHIFERCAYRQVVDPVTVEIPCRQREAEVVSSLRHVGHIGRVFTQENTPRRRDISIYHLDRTGVDDRSDVLLRNSHRQLLGKIEGVELPERHRLAKGIPSRARGSVLRVLYFYGPEARRVIVCTNAFMKSGEMGRPEITAAEGFQRRYVIDSRRAAIEIRNLTEGENL